MSDAKEKAQPVSEFKQNLNEVLDLLNQGNIPIIVTGDGKPEAVIQGLASHQQLFDAVEQSGTAEEIHTQFTAGNASGSQPLDEALRKILGGGSNS